MKLLQMENLLRRDPDFLRIERTLNLHILLWKLPQIDQGKCQISRVIPKELLFNIKLWMMIWLSKKLLNKLIRLLKSKEIRRLLLKQDCLQQNQFQKREERQIVPRMFQKTKEKHQSQDQLSKSFVTTKKTQIQQSKSLLFQTQLLQWATNL